METVPKHRDIKFVTTEEKKLFVVRTKLSYYKVFFTENLLAIGMRKTQILMKKPAHLGLSILDLSKTVKNEFWLDHVKQKYGEKPKLCYMDTDSFIVHVRTNDMYKDIAEDVQTRFDTSNYKLSRPLPKGHNKKIIGVMNNEWWKKFEIMCWIKSKIL